jgi:hypothetical protein
MKKKLEPVYASDIERAIKIMHPSGVFEIRGIGMQDEMYTGYFTSPKQAAKVVTEWANLNSYRGLYITLNQLHKGTLARRRPNSFSQAGKAPTTSDNDVVKRRWILVDVDVTRPAGISASGEEVELSRVVRNVLAGWAFDFWPGRIINAASGNGSHMLLECQQDYRDSEVKAFLQNVPNLVDDLRVSAILGEGICKVDCKVFNRGRISRLYGTYACKGFQLPEQDRIYRKSYIEEVYCVKSQRSDVQARGLQLTKQTDNSWDAWEDQLRAIHATGGRHLD